MSAPSLSHRAAIAAQQITDMRERFRFADAVAGASSFEKLPSWARKLITDSEAD